MPAIAQFGSANLVQQPAWPTRLRASDSSCCHMCDRRIGRACGPVAFAAQTLRTSKPASAERYSRQLHFSSAQILSVNPDGFGGTGAPVIRAARGGAAESVAETTTWGNGSSECVCCCRHTIRVAVLNR